MEDLSRTARSGKGLFGKYQPLYAEYGIPTFPVGPDKKPLVSHYQKIGKNYSAQLSERFPHADAFGLVLGQRSGLTIVDVDTKDITILEKAQGRYGESNLIIETGGGYHAYYRHGGEGRQIRADVLVDILGSGYAVAPPSITAKGQYRIVKGSLDSLHDLCSGLPYPMASETPRCLSAYCGRQGTAMILRTC
jgi:hypothetical protein